MLEIRLPDDLGKTLRERAQAAHADVNVLAERLLRRALASPSSVDDLLPEAAARFRQSGMTDDQLGAELEDAKHDARKHRRHGAA